MQEVDAYGLSHRGRFAIVGRPLYDFPSLLKWPLQFRMIPPPGVKTGCVLGFTDQVLEAQKIARSFGPGCPNLIRESDGSVPRSPCDVGCSSDSAIRSSVDSSVCHGYAAGLIQ